MSSSFLKKESKVKKDQNVVALVKSIVFFFKGQMTCGELILKTPYFLTLGLIHSINIHRIKNFLNYTAVYF